MGQSGFKRFLKVLFGANDRANYNEAMSSLDRVYQNVNKIGMEFPDVHSFEFQVVKNKWRALPEEVASKVDVMGLHIEDDYRSVLTHYCTHGEIAPHKHSKEWEIIQVLEGWCIDKFTNTKLLKGDVYIIPRGMEHHIVTEGEECYMYILFTEHKEHLIIPHTEPNLAKKYISKKRLNRPEKIKS